MKRKIVLPVPLILVIIFAACNNLDFRLNSDMAFESMIKIRDAESNFKNRNGRYGTLQELGAANLIDTPLASGIYYGHRYEVRAQKDSYVAVVVPVEYGENAYHGTGYVSLYLDESGIIRGGDKRGAEATVNDESIGKQ